MSNSSSLGHAGSRFGIRTLFGVALVALTVTALAGPSSAADSRSSLSKSEASLLATSQPKEVLMDSQTGEIVSVTALPADSGGITPSAVVNPCNTTQPCWKAYTTPYSNLGFTGSGASGTWDGRGKFYSMNRNARVTWVLAGVTKTGVWVPPNTTVSFTQYPLTGKKVELTS